ncbi:MAG: glycosyltransferase [Methylothermaceae bacterium]|nr:glycosyltransferase [Methylothermaceae bacterium]
MRVLWLTSSYPRFEHDSASIFLQHLAHSLQSQGVDIHVLTPDDFTIDPKDSSIPLHLFRYFTPRSQQKLAYGSGILPNLKRQPLLYGQIPFFLLGMATGLWRQCRMLKPDLIHAHWIIPQGTVAAAIGNPLTIPVIVTAHGGDAFALKSPLLNRIKAWTVDNAAAWTCNTLPTAQAIQTRPSLPPARIIPMGVDYHTFAHASPDALIREKADNRIILFVGRLVEKKGVGDLIEAFGALDRAIQEKTRLWIVGDGSEKTRLHNQVDRLGLGSRIRFWGKMPHHRLPTFYATADLFVAPSVTDRQGDTEGQGVVFLEAMASATPVIATRTGGIGEIVEHGKTGILVEPRQSSDLKSAITQLLLDNRLREQLAAAGQTKARDYDWHQIGAAFSRLYSETIASYR